MAIQISGNTVINNSRKGTLQIVNPGSFTTTERDALSTDVLASGDVIYNSTADTLQVYNATTPIWNDVGVTRVDGGMSASNFGGVPDIIDGEDADPTPGFQ